MELVYQRREKDRKKKRVRKTREYLTCNAHPSLSHTSQIVVSPQRKKLLQLYALSGDKLVHLKDYGLPETAVLMVSNVEGKVGGGKRGEGREEGEGKRERT